MLNAVVTSAVWTAESVVDAWRGGYEWSELVTAAYVNGVRLRPVYGDRVGRALPLWSWHRDDGRLYHLHEAVLSALFPLLAEFPTPAKALRRSGRLYDGLPEEVKLALLSGELRYREGCDGDRR